MILGAKFFHYELGFERPVAVGDSLHRSRSGFLLGLWDDEGHVGWGDAAPLPGWSRDSLAHVEVAFSSLAAAISDRPRSAETLRDTAAAWSTRLPAARAALDMALLDLAARSQDISVAAFLVSGTLPAERVPVNSLIKGQTPDACGAAAATAAREGFSVFKLKLGECLPSLDVERVAAVRDAVGPSAVIRVDVASRWDVETALSALKLIEPFNIEYVEDPVAGIDELSQVAANAAVPVAVDAMLAHDPDPFAVVAAVAADVFILKPSAIGGLVLSRQVATRIAEDGRSAVVTSFLDSAIGLTGAVHLVASLPPVLASGLATSDLLAENVAEPPPIERGAILVPTGPGFGIEPFRKGIIKRERTEA